MDITKYEEFDDNLQLALTGDEDAKQRILDNLKPLIKSSIRRYCPIYEEYEDLYSDGIIVVLECLETFDRKRSFLKYVKSYLKYFYFETFRYLKKYQSVDISKSRDCEDDLDGDFLSQISDDYILEDEFIKKENLEILTTAIGLLTDRQREILSLYYFQNLSLSEISEYLGISRWTVVNLKRNAVNNLRRFLGDFR